MIHHRSLWKPALCLFLSLFLCPLYPLNAAPLPTEYGQELVVLTPYKKHIEQRLVLNRALIDDIAKQLSSQSLPSQLVLLPMLESSFDPNAVSHANAAGLWQLMPATAQRFGLKVDANQDQRFDIQASTKVAIEYLAFLHNKFDDLALTIAAYNAGEGRISRAIKKSGSKAFSSLKLPAETTQYVHRFYALLNLIQLERLLGKPPNPLFLFGESNHSPLIDLSPLPPLITL
ncbi:lytic transglycosylase domain-containing protein [Vibrio neptunius]|uniref:Lytic transglycosylase domain-containing protein n=1 Tax=Vibrio neptunius TaxID=170651 RepID=A0ABS3A7K5_9VIBR|nr:lytic transglycosylase domain-containing protein [Vibrio neptunius]MBN3495033.1 lytic transglycosylase domain-containing protein [Vibrio neptunius]MBN3517440.1 lytic transglycosylase domain-containing protein [Vibrio neptunius]MBN3551388.1 lytic transglycosylase domain-containing protein [Vibrio neptunius]MBN3579834.1 lytic transglycosylase domain-containing protein [Vibrio neptunius]MCH9873500.1 lytic transglycosylase domain-containing protein [Vibrio neptunius]